MIGLQVYNYFCRIVNWGPVIIYRLERGWGEGEIFGGSLDF